MSPTADVAAQPGVGSKLKVFVSYSRKDSSFAEELVSGLELCGFDAYLDKDDIAPGEPWEIRLGRLIREGATSAAAAPLTSLRRTRRTESSYAATDAKLTFEVDP